jgi:hypothetical protein
LAAANVGSDKGSCLGSTLLSLVELGMAASLRASLGTGALGAHRKMPVLA